MRDIYNTRIINTNYSPEFVLGILNSTLFKFYFKQFIAPDTNIFPKIRIAQLKEIPIPQKPPQDLHDRILKQVEQVLKFNEEKQRQTLQSKIDQLQSRIDYCEQKINEIVYKLYGLNEEEIKIIEG